MALPLKNLFPYEILKGHSYFRFFMHFLHPLCQWECFFSVETYVFLSANVEIYVLLSVLRVDNSDDLSIYHMNVVLQREREIYLGSATNDIQHFERLIGFCLSWRSMIFLPFLFLWGFSPTKNFEELG